MKMKDETIKRHLTKSITWRVIGTLDTLILSWAITGNLQDGIKIGGVGFFSKFLLYFLHERMWYKINLAKIGIHSDRARHIAKTISWRLFGTVETIILSWIITGDSATGIKIGVVEVITKMVLYYLHERIWFKFDFGLVERDKN